MLQAIAFDIGQTLVEYRRPLNWSRLYRPALTEAAAACGRTLSEARLQAAAAVLSRYNTRIHPREMELSSEILFTALLREAGLPRSDLPRFRDRFYGFFRRDAEVFPDALEVLPALSSMGISIGILSDVPYAMDNARVLADIAPLMPWIAYPLTSNDVGLRKPRPEGLLRLAAAMGVPVARLVFVGDEEKDMECARRAGACPVLLDRAGRGADFGQTHTIATLRALPALILEIHEKA